MKFTFSKYVWFDGKFVHETKANIPVTTHAIHYGTSVFEGIRAYWNTKNLFIFIMAFSICLSEKFNEIL